MATLFRLVSSHFIRHPIVLRRLLALLTNIAMLHLTLVGGAFVCQSHAPRANASMSGMAMEHAAAGAHDSAISMAVADHSVPASHQGEPESQPRCCTAMSGCGVTMTVAVAEQGADVAAPAGASPPLAGSSPLSRRPAPEPPPPKG